MHKGEERDMNENVFLRNQKPARLEDYLEFAPGAWAMSCLWPSTGCWNTP